MTSPGDTVAENVGTGVIGKISSLFFYNLLSVL